MGIQSKTKLMGNYNEVVELVYWGNTVRAYLSSLLILVLSLIVIQIAKYIFVKRLKKLSRKTKNNIDDFIIDTVDGIPAWVLFIIAFYIAAQKLVFPAIVHQILDYTLMIVLTIQAVLIVQRIIKYALKSYARAASRSDNITINKTIVNYVQRIVGMALWAVALVLILANLGYDVTSLIAGLGIGGVALALASQKVLENLINSLTIVFEQPFKEGDFIVVGQQSGTVKAIGLRSTKITSIQGEELVIPNGDLMSERIHNFKRMDKRRIVFKIGVTYETSLTKLKKVPTIIKKILKAQKHIDQEKGKHRVHCKQFADSSITFEVMYYVVNSDYEQYLDTQASINYEIVKAFEAEKIEMAYPTQTVYLKQ